MHMQITFNICKLNQFFRRRELLYFSSVLPDFRRNKWQIKMFEKFLFRCESKNFPCLNIFNAIFTYLFSAFFSQLPHSNVMILGTCKMMQCSDEFLRLNEAEIDRNVIIKVQDNRDLCIPGTNNF